MQDDSTQQDLSLGRCRADYEDALQRLERRNFSTRMWCKDPNLWTKDPDQADSIVHGLGWLRAPDLTREHLGNLGAFRDEVVDAGFEHVVHMGMGGSSLAPLLFQRTFEPGEGGLPLTVIDTNDPATIERVESSIPLAKTLFIVASKSGTTAETRALGDYFFQRVKSETDADPGASFVAITDEGSPLEDLADERGFRKTWLNFPGIGGRYSALSYFGMVPATLMGLPLDEMLQRVAPMENGSSLHTPVADSSAMRLGAAMGALAQQGRDKVTFIFPESLETLGMWLEQLLAESTGKEGTGLIPIAGEPVAPPDNYGDDRFFVWVHLQSQFDQEREAAVEGLKDAGHPVAEIELSDLLDIAREFYRWEIAVATAGSVLGINAFNQPNVQAAKDNTSDLLDTVRDEGSLPELDYCLEGEPLKISGDCSGDTTEAALEAFLSQANEGDYFTLLAYLTETDSTTETLQDMRLTVRDRLKLATAVGYGPRYLHSTGQLHKGGPNTGLFIQITASDEPELGVPDEPYSFSTFKHAEALGDLRALRDNDRRVLRIDIDGDLEAGLSALKRAVIEATS